MIASPSLSVTDRFSAHMVELRNVLLKHCVRFGQPVMLVMLAMDYLRRGDGRFQRLMERYRAGTLGPPKPRKPPPKRARPQGSQDEADAKPKRFSQAFGWFATLIRPDGFRFADQLRETLADPETKAAMAASPQVGRVLRPMCRMFGVADDSITLPRRPRRKPEPTADQLYRRQLRAEAKEFAELSKTSSKKSVVPRGHTFPTNARDWAIWIRRSKRQARDSATKNRKAGL